MLFRSDVVGSGLPNCQTENLIGPRSRAAVRSRFSTIHLVISSLGCMAPSPGGTPRLRREIHGYLQVNKGSTFDLRRSTLDFGLGGQRSSSREVNRHYQLLRGNNFFFGKTCALKTAQAKASIWP